MVKYLGIRLVFFAAYVYLFECEYLKLSIKNGQILGKKEITQFNNKPYCAFTGIRYGDAERFEPPKAAKPWDGVYNATFDRPTCIQFPKRRVEESEDCLFLNVYTPTIANNTKLLPVMFWIYGGFFLYGDALSTTLGPDYLIDENIVVVTINYRLGIFGFLSSGDQVLPGNLGLRDVILGLQWVQKNIHFFNGNPKNVTVSGQSAGAAIISYLMLSPLVEGKGYFQRAILQSGTALASWAYQRSPDKIFRSVALVSLCGLNLILGSTEVIKCLKTISSDFLRDITAVIFGAKSVILAGILNGLPFTPVIEKPSRMAVVTEPTYKKLLKGDTEMVPMIVGITSEETISFEDVLNFKPLVDAAINMFQKIILPDDAYISNFADQNEALQIVKNYYHFDGFLILPSQAQFLQATSDSFFVRQWRQFLEMTQKRTKTYCYVFSYYSKMSEGHHNLYKGLGKVGHGEENNYIWRNNFSQGTHFPKFDYVMRKRTVRLWTNFVKYGKPTPFKDNILENVYWRTSNYNGSNNNCLNIDRNMGIIDDYRGDSFRMWKSIYDNFGHPIDTY